MAEDDKNKLFDENDKELWNSVTRHDKKIKHTRHIDDDVKNGGRKTKALDKPCSPDTTIHSHDINHCSLPDISCNQAFQIDKNTAKNFRTGKFPIEARLDLHGYTIEKAHYRLRDFIYSSYNDGKRCVLIITGKGMHSKGGEMDTIKENFSRWINLTGIREKVLMFSHAQPKDGGEGAVYVLIKRNKSLPDA